MEIKKITNFLLVLMLIALAIAPAFALGDGNRNLLLIIVMSISPVIIFVYKGLYKSDFILILTILSLIISPLLNHPESMRWSTVLYSAMFCLAFMAMTRLIKTSLYSLSKYIKLIRNLIYAYALVLLIQQICVLTGLPVFNMSNYDPSTPWKLNSLSAEPSHSARIIALLMFSFVSMKAIVLNEKYQLKKNFQKDKWIWISFFYSMITMGSSTALLFILLILLKVIDIIKARNFIIGGAVVVLLVVFSQSTSVSRTYNTFLATLTLNETAILKADHSAAMRIVPIIVAAKKTSFTGYDAWLGHGVDYTTTFMSDRIPGISEGSGGGGSFQIWVEYGLISFLLFIVFTIRLTLDTKDKLTFLFWFLIVFIVGINNQIVWLFLTLIFINTHFKKVNEKKQEHIRS